MRPMRRAVLAILLCAAPLTTAPAYASPSLAKLQALRQASRLEAGAASSGGVAALPLSGEPSARASSVGELTRIARASGPVHLLVGVRRHADLAGVTQLLRSLGATPESFPAMGVLAATAPGGTSVAGALRDDPRVAFVERNERLRMAVDSLDTVDPATGYKYTWAYDAVRAGRGARRHRRRVTPDDRGGGHGPRRGPPGVHRPHRRHLRHLHQGQRRDRHARPRHLRDRADRGHRRQRARDQGRGGQHARATRCAPRRTAASRRATCCAASTTRSSTAPTCST